MKNLSICTVIKNEALYLEEWIAYHRHIGFDHFYIYNNNSNDNPYPIFQKYRDIVTFKEWDLNDWQQKLAYKDYCENYSNDSKWTAFIDVDEFIVYKGNKGLLQHLIEEEVDVAYAHWKIFGTNGHVKRPNGLVIQNYTATHSVCPNPLWKTICRSSLIDSDLIDSPHRFKYKTDKIKYHFDKDILNLYHYMLKSEEDLKYRYTKGDVWNAKNAKIRSSYVDQNVKSSLNKYNNTDIIDDYMLKYVPLIKNRIAAK
jgi:hypothetical protein